MTDLETQVEALMQTLHTTPVSWDGIEAGPNVSVISSSDVRALLTSLVQEKADQRDRLLELLQIFEPAVSSRIPPIGEVVERARVLLATEARLATVEQERDALRVLCEVVETRLTSLVHETLTQAKAALTPSRMDPP